ncbi:MAG: 2'-5' RNA ligase family protein [Chryseobacterium sp.]|uniref:2'-5' RNA ligase family protein n=1 Tax=Chryseobacterium sp. TaxID=1871047 RepID=UPI0025C310BF|nr:2'-5' RNA ligase family protein [Chryseobacterium sp.]MCJ7933572.1 2'-5' RNA ligase family protein [Chryseobacterium sp.]
MKKLYFIAIYPPEEMIEEIKVFKRDFAEEYGNSKALKNDAHLTLFPPFFREIELENDIFTAFRKIDTQMPPFEIVMNGFGSFPNPKNPVIFAQPENNACLTELYQRVTQQFNFARYSFNPHMTVGYRDLTWENYLKAWEKYEHKEYKTKFLVDKISLLRHDGKWIPIAEKNLENK